MIITKKICQYCNIEYNARRSSSKYCSKECQIKVRTKKVKVKCDYCGKEIEKKACHMKQEHHFCNSKCRGKWDSENKIGKNHPQYTSIEVKCSYCGKLYIIRKYKLNETEKHYCSRECKHNDLKGKKHTEEYKEKMRDITPKGKDSPHWKHNKTDEERLIGRATPQDHEWRTQVLKRDNYTCQHCGKHGGDMNAHHLNGYHWDIEHRHDINNGITLCKKCHKSFHNKYGNRNNTREQYEEFIKKII